MGTLVSYEANSSNFILDGHSITDFAIDDYIDITMQNPHTSRVNGANGSLSITKSVIADVGMVVFRVQKGSNNDSMLQNWKNQDTARIMGGSFSQPYTVDGVSKLDSYSLEAGTFTDPQEHKFNNVEHNSITEYTIEFRTLKRTL